ncbi:hypothetical protein Tco_0746539 [Tanacetum coccineum]
MAPFCAKRQSCSFPGRHVARECRPGLICDSDTVGISRIESEKSNGPERAGVQKQKMSADVARGHGGDGGGDDRPPPYQGTRKPKFGGMREGRLQIPARRPDIGLKAISDKSGPVPNPTQFDSASPIGYLTAGHKCFAGIHQHLQKIYNGRRLTLKRKIVVPEEDGTYDLERIRRGRLSYISEVDWDAQLAFWNDPKNLARAAQNKQNRAKSKVMRPQHFKSPVADPHLFLTHMLRQYSSNPEAKLFYVGLGSNYHHGCALIEESHSIVRRGHIPGSKRGESAHATSEHVIERVWGCGDDEPGDDEEATRMRRIEDDKLRDVRFEWNGNT